MASSRFLSVLSKCRTVEPVVFLYSFGLLIHSPLIQQYVYDRVSEDKGYNNSINSRTECANDTELHDEVESKTSFILLGLVVICAVPALVTGVLIGAWSDIVGRKPAIVLPCLGATVDMSVTLLVVSFDLPLYLLYAGSVFNGMTGYFPAITLSTMAFIADTTDESLRATRLGVLQFFVFIGGTVGQAISGKIIESHGGYKLPYWIVCGCLLASTLYAIFIVPETLPKERREKSALFDRKHFRSVLNILKKQPDVDGNTLRRLILISYLLNVSYFGAYTVTILFLLDKPLCWTPLDIGLFFGERFFCLGIGAVIGVKVLSRCFTTMQIIYFGILTNAASLAMFAFAKHSGLVVTVPVVGMFIGASFAYLRSMMSKQTSAEQQGSLFAACGFFDTLATVTAAFIFNILYPLSLKIDFNGLSFLVSAGIALVVFYLTTQLNEPLPSSPAETTDEDSKSIDEKSPLLLHDVHSTYST